MGKARVLIVDDEVDYLSMMKERLEFWGHEVLLAQGGEEALLIIKDKKPEVVILDYLMPDMDGVTVLKEIRKTDKHLPVIMLTAHPEADNIKEAKKLSVSAFIPKISAYSDVHGALKSALDLIIKQKK